MKIQIIQDEYQGIPQAPELFLDEEKALAYFEDKVTNLGFRGRFDDENGVRYLQRFNEWFADENDKDDPIRWWEIDLPFETESLKFVKEFIKAMADKSKLNTWETAMVNSAIELVK